MAENERDERMKRKQQEVPVPAGQSKVYEHSSGNSPASAMDVTRVLRFLREREQELMEQLREDVADARAHDAVSGDEVAFHLGWVNRDAAGGVRPQTERATRVLEALCSEQRVVCFSRPRMRRGENGDIRLYCTQEHLDALTRLMQEPEASVTTA
jgi:hypothetical protein